MTEAQLVAGVALAALEPAPSEALRAAAAVLGDWLVEQGEPRGPWLARGVTVATAVELRAGGSSDEPARLVFTRHLPGTAPSVGRIQAAQPAPGVTVVGEGDGVTITVALVLRRPAGP